jgi:alpha-beta hydrolase superfamily lysophospholipase
MKHSTDKLVVAGDLALHSESWLPEAPPKAVVLVVHGITEHLGRYVNLVNPLVASGLGVCGFDLRGHGQSSGHRGHLSRWPELIADLNEYLRVMTERYPGIPVFLFGHSLGSLIVLARIIERSDSVAGIILSGTAIEPVGVASLPRVVLARLFSAVWPRCFIPISRRSRATLSRDPKVENAFWNDPLVLPGVTARFGSEGLDLIKFVRARAASVTLPLLMIHGGADPLNTLAGAQRFFDEAASTDKAMIIYPGGLHEPINDLDQDQVIADLLAWIQKRH